MCNWLESGEIVASWRQLCSKSFPSINYTILLSILTTDLIITAYCDPPNPCPIGYTTADGCIEDFENSSEFSRGFQSRQKCICDTEHMFDCPEENAHRGADDITAVVSV